MEELQFSSHIDMYVREITNKRYEKATFVFNLYHCPDESWQPLYLCYVNDIKQHGYVDSTWHQSDRVYDAHRSRLEDCEQCYCYCGVDPHHTFEIEEDRVKRYLEIVLDIGDVTDSQPKKKDSYTYCLTLDTCR